MIRTGALLAVAILLGGCSGVKSSRRMRPEVQAPPEAWSGVGRIAVLPPDNWTLDVGFEYIAWYRAVVHELLREKGYAVTPLAQVNRFFLRNKFSMAGEANSYTVAELSRSLDADAILYWAITSNGPNLMFALERADGTALWGTGEVALGLSHVAPVSGRYNHSDGGVALVLGEILRHLPARVP